MADKPLVAHQGDHGADMKEFDPECECHIPLLIVKAVDPGCTLEVQIENAITRRVHRMTTGQSARDDMAMFEAALIREFRVAWCKMKPYD